MNAPLLPGQIEHWPLARLKPTHRHCGDAEIWAHSSDITFATDIKR
jgi:hypothetical protein